MVSKLLDPKGAIFAPVNLVFPAWSLVMELKLYQLKSKCGNS